MSAGSNQVRIIAGQWRGRKLGFPDGAGLRPTSDRIRETLFNWLAPVLPGSRCLDLFAGSGALGFEAASRGAGRVVMVDSNPAVVKSIRDNGKRVGADTLEVHCRDAADFLAGTREAFDIVFVDPPFADGALLNGVLGRLADGACLKRGALVYVEAPKKSGPTGIPSGWSLLREKHAGQVTYRLYRSTGGAQD